MVRIGVTGHRFLSGIQHLTTRVDEALAQIAQSWPGQEVCIISPLAEGADCLVVERILYRFPKAAFFLLLPLPIEDYLGGFSSDTSRDKFWRLYQQTKEIVNLPPAGTRTDAYLAAGLYILDHCDALIAIWDGLPARGPGGTGEIVAEARQRKLPLAWVRSEDRQPGKSSLPHDEKTKWKVVYENFQSGNKT